jgi:ADP-heptose:LPS heptosyltransferase
VLFLRHDRIGDMIVSTGALRAIAAAHPNLALDVLASPGNAPVLRGLPGCARSWCSTGGGRRGSRRPARRLRAGATTRWWTAW